MKLFQLGSKTSGGGPRWRPLLSLGWALAIGVMFLPQAKADFVGDYALGNFTLTNTNGDGTATTPDNGVTVVLTGPNNGSGDAGSTDLTIAAVADGTISFDYLYSSLDDPSFDFAGYLLGNSFIQLTDHDGDSGTVQFSVSAGEIFGFRVATIDNTFEPGILTLSGFSASTGTSTAPEPGSVLLVGSGALIALGFRQARRKMKAGAGAKS